jgi:hypothetical protein
MVRDEIEHDGRWPPRGDFEHLTMIQFVPLKKNCKPQEIGTFFLLLENHSSWLIADFCFQQNLDKQTKKNKESRLALYVYLLQFLIQQLKNCSLFLTVV